LAANNSKLPPQMIHRLAALPPDAVPGGTETATKACNRNYAKLATEIMDGFIGSECAANSLSRCTFSGVIEFHNRQYTMAIRLFYDDQFSQRGPGQAAINVAFTDRSPGLRTQE
jgi:hypothetical protein